MCEFMSRARPLLGALINQQNALVIPKNFSDTITQPQWVTTRWPWLPLPAFNFLGSHSHFVLLYISGREESLSYHQDHVWKRSKDAGDRIYFVSNPEQIIHALYPAVSAYFYVDARVLPCVFSLMRWHAHVFSAKQAGLNKLFCLFLCLLSARLVGLKSSHFAVQKMVR